MTEKERTHFFFFFARVRVYPMMRFLRQNVLFLKAKKEQSFGDGFRGKSRENAHAFYIARKDDEHETIAEISHREKRR